jgi:hypothetical protein
MDNARIAFASWRLGGLMAPAFGSSSKTLGTAMMG